MIQYNQRRRQIVLNLLVGHQNNIKLSYPIHVLGLFYGRELNFVAMVAKTLQKPAFSPPSLHKMGKICGDGICHGRPDLAPDLASGLKQGLKPDQPCRSDKDVEIRYMRVRQYNE